MEKDNRQGSVRNGRDENKLIHIYIVISLFMSQSFEFAAVTSTEITGFLQAVSPDGKVTVYGTPQKYDVYYYHDEKILRNSFSIPYYITDVKEKYNEQAEPFSKVHAILINDVIKVYLISANKHHVARVEIPDHGKGAISINEQQFSWEVQDMAIHPSDDCLVVLGPDSAWVLFQEAHDDFQMEFSTEEAEIRSGKLFAVQEGNARYYYIFCIQSNSEKSEEELKIYKLQELSTGEDFTSVGEKLLSLQNTSNQFSKIQYESSQQLFAVNLEYMTNSTRDKTTFYFNDKLTLLKTQGEVTAESFVGFVEGEGKVMLGNYYFPDDYCQLYQICILPYQTTTNFLKYQTDEEECSEKYFDRVGVLHMDNHTYYLTQIDQTLTISNESLSSELTSINLYTFSTKYPNTLISSKCSTLQYLTWQEKQVQSQTPESTTQVGMIVALCVFGVAFIILLFFILRSFSLRNKQKEKQQNSKVKIENQQTNPYLNPFAHKQIQTPKKQKTSKTKKGKKESEIQVSKSLEDIKKY